ncbi:MAG: hypothetical protein KBA61_18715 [Spirochaetes bacterium]|nr:hypothetical protein [Spirochaetota bacterium]
MKSMRCALTVLFLLAGINAAYSLDVSLGVNAWYMWSSPTFEDQFRGEGNDITADDPVNNGPAYNDSWKLDPVMLLGPILNIRFSERWSLGLIFLVSQDIDVESSYDVDNSSGTPFPFTFNAVHSWVFNRYDGDLTVNYRFDCGLGFFVGFKYLRWTAEGTYDITTTPEFGFVSHTDAEVNGLALGPAFGLSYIKQLKGMLFFTASASGMVIKSREEQRNATSTTLPAPTYTDVTKTERPYYGGFNGMAGLGYYFSALSSTLILGGRLQYLKSKDEPRDIFYGVTATAMYSF